MYIFLRVNGDKTVCIATNVTCIAARCCYPSHPFKWWSTSVWKIKTQHQPAEWASTIRTHTHSFATCHMFITRSYSVYSVAETRMGEKERQQKKWHKKTWNSSGSSAINRTLLTCKTQKWTYFTNFWEFILFNFVYIYFTLCVLALVPPVVIINIIISASSHMPVSALSFCISQHMPVLYRRCQKVLLW